MADRQIKVLGARLTQLLSPVFFRTRKNKCIMIESIKIRGFAPFEEETCLVVNTGSVGFIGYNGSGKTSLLEAFRYVTSPLNYFERENEKTFVEIDVTTESQRLVLRRSSTKMLEIDGVQVEPGVYIKKLEELGIKEPLVVSSRTIPDFVKLSPLKVLEIVNQLEITSASNILGANQESALSYPEGSDYGVIDFNDSSSLEGLKSSVEFFKRLASKDDLLQKTLGHQLRRSQNALIQQRKMKERTEKLQELLESQNQANHGLLQCDQTDLQSKLERDISERLSLIRAVDPGRANSIRDETRETIKEKQQERLRNQELYENCSMQLSNQAKLSADAETRLVTLEVEISLLRGIEADIISHTNILSDLVDREKAALTDTVQATPPSEIPIDFQETYCVQIATLRGLEYQKKSRDNLAWDMAAELGAMERNLSFLNRSYEELDSKLSAANVKKLEIQTELKKVQRRLEDKKFTQDWLSKYIESSEQQLMNHQGYLKVTAPATVELNIEGRRRENLDLLRSHFPGVHGFLKEVYEVKQAEFSAAVNRALGSHNHSIIVENLSIASACMEYVKIHKMGRQCFLLMDDDNRLYTPRARYDVPGDVKYLIDAIEFDVKVEKALFAVLGNSLLASNMDRAQALRDSDLLPKNEVIYTLDGQVLQPSNTMELAGFNQEAAHGTATASLQTELHIKDAQRLMVQDQQDVNQAVKAWELQEDTLQMREATLQRLIESLTDQKLVHQQLITGAQTNIEKLREKHEEEMRSIENINQRIVAETQSLDRCYYQFCTSNGIEATQGLPAEYLLKNRNLSDASPNHARAQGRLWELSRNLSSRLQTLESTRKQILKIESRRELLSLEHSQRFKKITELEKQTSNLEEKLSQDSTIIRGLSDDLQEIEEDHQAKKLHLRDIERDIRKTRENIRSNEHLLEKLSESAQLAAANSSRSDLNEIKERCSREIIKLRAAIARYDPRWHLNDESVRRAKLAYDTLRRAARARARQRHLLAGRVERYDQYNLWSLERKRSSFEATCLLFYRAMCGNTADLSIFYVDAEDPFSGLKILIQPPHKTAMVSVAMLSGGEQALAVFAFTLAIEFLGQRRRLVILDEVDASLDNSAAFMLIRLLRKMDSHNVQFLIATHNNITRRNVASYVGIYKRHKTGHEGSQAVTTVVPPTDAYYPPRGTSSRDRGVRVNEETSRRRDT